MKWLIPAGQKQLIRFLRYGAAELGGKGRAARAIAWNWPQSDPRQRVGLWCPGSALQGDVLYATRLRRQGKQLSVCFYYPGALLSADLKSDVLTQAVHPQHSGIVSDRCVSPKRAKRLNCVRERPDGCRSQFTL